MPKFDDFDLDVKSTASKSGDVNAKVTSYSLCTPGTCNSKCKPTAWLCSDVCITKTCLTCV
ncbi:MAG: gallidermin/nisin family lantibiotic [Lachnospiraceae bacterium]|nr:gallidermin/nisin family lantibiotic [Lachnospiraceae bacterium]